MTPFDDFVYLINHVLLGEEPTIEDFILLVGTLVAFIAFILWCCFPIQPKNHIKAFDAAKSNEKNNDNAAAKAAAATSSGSNSGGSSNGSGGIGGSSNNNMATGSGSNANGSIANGGANNNLSNNSQYNGSYSKNGTVAMHNYYVKNGHHCCT